MRYKNKRRLIIGISLFLLILLYIFKNYFFMMRVLGVILGLGIFYFFDHAFQVHFKFRHYIYIIIILLFGILLSPLYFYSEIYDKLLHLIMPIFVGIIMFFIINNLQIDFKYKLTITFTSIVCALAILEIGEYLFDIFLDFKTQGVYIRDITGLEKYKLVLGKNDDTMIDLITGLMGSSIFVLGKTGIYYFKKYSKKFRLLDVF